MGHNSFTKCLAIVLGLAAMLGLQATASAKMALIIDDHASGGYEIIILDDADGNVGDSVDGVLNSNTADALAGDGAVQFDGTVGVFGVTVATGQSKPSLNGLSLSIVVNSSAAGTIDIYLSDTDYLADLGSTLVTDIGGTTEGSLQYTVGYSSANEIFAYTASAGGPLSGPSFSATRELPLASPQDPFAITQWISITHDGGGDSTSLTATSVHLIPEPTTLLALAGGVIALVRRRRGN